MKKKWKIILGSIVVLVVMIFMITQALQGEQVEVKEVKKDEIRRSFTEEGRVVAEKEHNIFSLYSASIHSIYVEEGDRVEEGDLLAKLDIRELEYRVQGLQASLRGIEGEEMQLTRSIQKELRFGIQQAQEHVEILEKNYQRMKSLYDNGALSKIELEEAEQLFKDAQYSLAQLEASNEGTEGSLIVIEASKSAILSQINILQYQIDNYHVKAHFSGVIANIEVKENDLVGPGVPIMTLYQKDSYLIEAQVLTRDVFDLTEGQSVNLTFELRDRNIMFPGEIIRISNYAQKDLSPLGLEEERVKVTIMPSRPEEIVIAPGYRVDVEFVTMELADQLAVPKSALFKYEGEDALFVVENNRVRVRHVTKGFETRRDIVITDGIKEGDLILLNPQAQGIDVGTRVSYRIINE